MEGFIHIRVSPWLRRLITRSLAIIPTIIVVAFTGERGTEKLLLLSQVILSLQLSFAVIPLVLFTGSRKKMANSSTPPGSRRCPGSSPPSSPDSTPGSS